MPPRSQKHLRLGDHQLSVVPSRPIVEAACDSALTQDLAARDFVDYRWMRAARNSLMNETSIQSPDPIAMAAEIVAAFVAKNSLPISELPALIEHVHAAVAGIVRGAPAPKPPEHGAVRSPAAIRKSITPDYLVCFEDGKKFQSLRRHLKGLGLTPDEYRAKWNLPGDYPMVAANYAARRSALAKQINLGRWRDHAKTTASGVAAPDPSD